MFDYYHIEIHISLQQFDRTLKLPFKILEFALYIFSTILKEGLSPLKTM
jgi:hypothetical protein